MESSRGPIPALVVVRRDLICEKRLGEDEAIYCWHLTAWSHIRPSPRERGEEPRSAST